MTQEQKAIDQIPHSGKTTLSIKAKFSNEVNNILNQNPVKGESIWHLRSKIGKMPENEFKERFFNLSAKEKIIIFKEIVNSKGLFSFKKLSDENKLLIFDDFVKMYLKDNIFEDILKVYFACGLELKNHFSNRRDRNKINKRRQQKIITGNRPVKVKMTKEQYINDLYKKLSHASFDEEKVIINKLAKFVLTIDITTGSLNVECFKTTEIKE